MTNVDWATVSLSSVKRNARVLRKYTDLTQTEALDRIARITYDVDSFAILTNLVRSAQQPKLDKE